MSTHIDEELSAHAYVEDPGNLDDSIISFPQQVLDAMTSATDGDLVAQLRTETGDVIDDVDLRVLDIEATETTGRFLVRVRGAANARLAAGVVVTGAALLAAALHLRHKKRR